MTLDAWHRQRTPTTDDLVADRVELHPRLDFFGGIIELAGVDKTKLGRNLRVVDATA
jgi:hypothetical protein